MKHIFYLSFLPLLVFLLSAGIPTKAQQSFGYAYALPAYAKNDKNPVPVGTKDGALLWVIENTKPQRLNFEWRSLDSLRLLSSQIISLETLPGENKRFEFACIHPGGLALYVSGLTEKTERTLFALPLGFDLMATDLPTPILSSYEDKNRDARFGFVASPSGRELLAHSIPNEPDRTEVSVKLARLSDGNRTVWSKELYLPFEQDAFDPNQFRLDDHGRIYMLSGIRPRKVPRAANTGGIKPESYTLLTYDSEANRLKEFDIALGDKWVMAASLTMSAMGDAIVTGYYSNNMFHSAAGVFYLRIEGATGGMAASGISAFGRQQTASFNRGSSALEMEHIFLDHVVAAADGSVWLIGEQYFVTERMVMEPGPRMVYQNVITEFHHGPICAARIDADGRLVSEFIVPKAQVTQNDGGRHSGYTMIIGKNGPVLFYLDNPKNSTATSERDMARTTTPSKSEWVATELLGQAMKRSMVLPASRLLPVSREAVPLPNFELMIFPARLDRDDGIMSIRNSGL